MTKLSTQDLLHAAKQLDVSLACVQAVYAVESNGTGFLANGKPVILLERHVARRLAARADFDVAKLQLAHPNVINVVSGGYKGGNAEWSRCKLLTNITNAAIAIESCSWGLFQIMGYHWRILDYSSAQAFSDAMHTNEAAQLQAFVQFVKRDSNLLTALQARNWERFARFYNGPGYRSNQYHTKLASAHERAHAHRG